MKKFFAALLLPVLLFGQYSQNDEALIKTTFMKKYDPKIISSYLHSSNGGKVKAALLSLSPSDDTNFVKQIITADFNKYGGYIAFALGQIGECSLSSDYLAKIVFSNNKLFRKESLEAFGKTANRQQLEQLLDYCNTHPDYNREGISLCLLNFFNRGIKSADISRKSFEILKEEFSSPKASDQRKADALFAFYRMGGSADYRDDLIKMLTENINVNVKQHLLASLRRISFFPADKALYNSLLGDKNPVIRIEAAKLLPFCNHSKSEDIDKYLTLVTDKNPNVSRQAAISVQTLKYSGQLKTELRDKLTVLLSNPLLPQNTKGEIFKSLIKLYPDEAAQLFGKYKESLRKDFVYEVAGDYSKELNLTEDYFFECYKKEDLKNRLVIANIILGINPPVINDRMAGFIIEGLNSSSPAVAATFAEGIQDTLIFLYKDKLSTAIEKQINLKYNDPDFYEASISLANLAKKISAEFYGAMIKTLSGSSVYSVKKYAAASSGSNKQAEKDSGLFEAIFNNSFKYKEAAITTEKGVIMIKFHPELAPVSVGNFCYLAGKGYFNNNMFHRVVPGFVIQAGDPTETGFGGPGHEIITEPSLEQYKTGAVGMASAGKDTEGSQWFIMQGYHPHLNGRYSLFAEVTQGMDTVMNIDQNEKVIKIELIK